MKIIIVGCGKVGFTLAEQLNSENHDITLIDSDGPLLQSVTETLDVMGVVGNGAISQVQIEAGIEEADLLIATTNSDEVNMLCCLIAKKAGNCHTIARVRNPEYAREVNFIREELNLSMAINPDFTAAREISRLIRFPSAIKIDTFSKGRVEILKFIVPEGSVLHNMQVMEISAKLHCRVLICAIERKTEGKTEVIIPNGLTQILAGDKLSFIGTGKESRRFFRQVGIVNNTVQNVMIIGGGRTSYYLAQILENSGIRVKIIERDKDICMELSEKLPKTTIIHGDATDQQLLMEEGIQQTEAFVALTGFDEENIMLSLYVGTQSKAKLITKVNKISFEDIINSMNLGSVIYPKLLVADYILRYVRAMQNSLGSNVTTLYKIAGNKAEALEFRVSSNSPVIGIPLEKLSLKPNLIVACVNRKGKIFTPTGQDTMESGDAVIIVTTNVGFKDLKDILA